VGANFVGATSKQQIPFEDDNREINTMTKAKEEADSLREWKTRKTTTTAKALEICG